MQGKRDEIVKVLQEEEFDILIIGGGVTGAGIALDAASRGLKTALVEKDDFASGTSGRSTKLVHGGLRYLKQLEIGLVSEVGRERAIVHNNAPHLVIPEKMLMPLIKGGTYGRISTSLGLTVYDILAGVRKSDRREMLNKEEALEAEPLLNPKNLLGAGYYSEYRTDDARLTIELIKAASRFGAKCVNYMKLSDFNILDGSLNGGTCTDLVGNRKIKINAKYVVNACGPWVDELRELNRSLSQKRLHLTKGVHLVVAHDKLPVNHSIYFDVPDGRMIFAIPRGKKTYIGTTDTEYKGDMDRVVTSRKDAEYLIQSINHTFPEVKLVLEDIEANWAGLRPLIHQEGKSASEISRKDEIFEAPDGLISIAGGKLTGYRKMAEKTVDLVAKRTKKDYGKSVKASKTIKISLLEDHLNEKDIEAYQEHVKEKLGNMGIDQLRADYLISNYGKQSEIILEFASQSDIADTELRLLIAELKYTLDYELVINSIDFFDRRTGRLYFDVESVIKYKDAVIDALAKHYDWNKESLEKEKTALDKKLFDVRNVFEEDS